MTEAVGALHHVEEVMGTVVSFRVECGEAHATAVRAAVGAACRLLHEVDGVFSTWQPASPLSRFRRGELALDELPDEVHEVAERCDAVRGMTGGWFDPWRMPGGFDPTGLVKGWAVERATARVATSGAAGGMVNAGGDLAVWGAPEPGAAWTIGVRHPEHRDALACVVRTDGAVATSGDYERGVHLHDPFAGRPACRVASATVTGPSLAVADGLATALAVAGRRGLAFVAAADGYEGMVIDHRGEGSATPGFAALVVPLDGTPAPGLP